MLSGGRNGRGVHLCFGNYGGQTIQKGFYRTLLPFFNTLECDHLVLEFARSGYDELDILREIKPSIAFGVGVVDIKDNEVETPDEIAAPHRARGEGARPRTHPLGTSRLRLLDAAAHGSRPQDAGAGCRAQSIRRRHPMTSQPQVRFAVAHINHHHIYAQVDQLLEAGAELASFYAPEPELAGKFAATYPQVRRAECEEEILDDPGIQLVVTSAIPSRRAALGARVMRSGKDFQTDKPGFTTLDQLAEVRRVQAETKRIYSISYNERLQVRAAMKAGELIKAGAIGKVIQMTGLGPHRVHPPERDPWFFDRSEYGGILADIASHQFEQFLYYTGSTKAEIVSSQVANFGHPEHPGFEDFGDVVLRGDGGMGYIRVDWFTPQGLGVWGDGRTFITGSDGYIELRKYIDIAGRPGKDHLLLVDHKGIQYIDCSGEPLTYGRQLVYDIIHRTETAMPQEHCFLASELALRAEASATRLGNLAG